MAPGVDEDDDPGASPEDSLLGALRIEPEGPETRRMRAAVADELFATGDTERVGRFTVGRCLGRGGMGTVYEAWDDVLDRHVALKMIRVDELPDDGRADAIEHILGEARALARLGHPNVVPVHEAGVDGGLVYIAMELVDGHLRAWARGLPPSGPTRWVLALDVMLQAIQGLAALHDAGLVHRDFKPANVLVRADGRAYVADLGLAKSTWSHTERRAIDPARGLTPSSPTRSQPRMLRATSVCDLVGTPAYMAPEQLAGEPATRSSDAYSLCLTFAELLLDERAPHGSARLAWVQALRERLPRRLAATLARGLSPQPERRPPSMRALEREVRAAIGPDRRIRAAATLIAAALVAAAGAIAWRNASIEAALVSPPPARIDVAFEDAAP